MEISNERVNALKKQALVLMNGRRLEEALALCSDVVRCRPDDAQAWYLLSSLNGAMGRMKEAGECCRRAIALRPDYSEAHVNLGNVLLSEGRHDEAIAEYRTALGLSPRNALAHCSLGNILNELRRHEEARSSYLTAIRLNPNLVEASYNLGNLMREQGEYDEALRWYREALSRNPAFATAHHNLGTTFLEMGNLESAREAADRAMGLYGAAVASYDRAIALNPGYAEAYSNRGVALRAMGRFQEALASCDRALSLSPDYAGAYNNRGIVLQDMHAYDDALASYDKAVELSPEYGDAWYNKALLHLLLGNFEEGWRLHEWRWRTRQLKSAARDFTAPLWLGERSPAGKIVLLHAEQGLGDAIQFARYAPMVAALGATVIVEAQPSLIHLLESLDGVSSLVDAGDPLPRFDMHCPFMSLPLAFQTTLADVPVGVPYLVVPEDRRNEWKQRLGAPSRPRIGLAWSGNPKHRNDRHRSIALRDLESLLQFDADYHAVQKEIRDEDRAVMARLTNLRNHEDGLCDFGDAAALVDEMDLIITVDTSAAHLAGALAKEVWILLPHTPDYRWLTNRSDCPWYPTARLFRQRHYGDWKTVISDVRSHLQNRLTDPRRRMPCRPGPTQL